MTPIFRWTLWQRRWSIIGWSIGVFFLIFINMIFYPSFRDQGEELQKSFENLPETAVQLFGGSTDFFSPVGFLNSQIFFLMLPLLLAILVIGLGSSLLGREEKDQTIEVLLARPVSRTKLLIAKVLAGGTITAIVGAVGLATIVITALAVDMDVSIWRTVLATLVCLLMVLSFGTVAFLFTAIGRARGASISIATIVAFGGYLIDSLAGTVEWLQTPAQAFPFHYYQSEAILRGTYNWNNVIFFIGLIAACGVVSWWAFRKRDLA
jgi:ABC-2 type transport system permease protein